jgi:hypothetical protein
VSAIIVRLCFLVLASMFCSTVVALPVQQQFDNLQISGSTICSQIETYYNKLKKDEDSDIAAFIITCNPKSLMFDDMFFAVVQIQRVSDGEWTSMTLTFSHSFTFDPEYIRTKQTLEILLGEEALSSLERNSILNLFSE